MSKQKAKQRKKMQAEVSLNSNLDSTAEMPPFEPDSKSSRDRLILFFFSWLVFLINLKYPLSQNFDEFHYVPSAFQWLELTKNQNWEHPPLAKQLMTFGLMIFGDDPIGWRFSSTLFGALTLVALHGAAEILFRSRKAALLCFVISFCNQLIYVQSRIAMLDTFMMAFLSAGFWVILKACYGRNVFSFPLMCLSGVCMGLAICCKWFSLIPYFIGTILLFLLILEKRFRAKGPVTEERKKAFRVNLRSYFIGWGFIAIIAYYIPFLGFFWIPHDPPTTLWNILWDFQWNMLSGQKSVGGKHPYGSAWWTWPFMIRPIWYAFDPDGPNKEWTRGVVLLGNPAVMWGGLLAIVWSAYEAFKHHLREHILLLSLYFGCILSWALIPRKLSFYYYYYPNGVLLSFFLVAFFMKLNRWKWTAAFCAIVLGFFIFFFPILGALRIPYNDLGRYMWFRSWI